VELTSSLPWDPKTSQFAEDKEQFVSSLNTIHPVHDRNIAASSYQPDSQPILEDEADFIITFNIMARKVAATVSTDRSH
jgi:hypothetical protein